MSGLAEKMMDHLHDHADVRLAWPPTQQLSLGDYGLEDDGLFYPQGNIFDPDFGLGVELESLGPQPSGEWEYVAESVLATRFSASGAGNVSNVANVSAGIKLDFTDSFGMYVGLGNLTVNRIANLGAVGERIMERWRNGKWERSLRIVSEVWQASNVVVVGSARRNTSFALAVEGDAPVYDLASAKLQLEIAYDNTTGTRFVSTGDPERVCTPVFRLQGIRWSFPHADFRMQPSAATASPSRQFYNAPDSRWSDA